ncbi:MAG: TetR/AcrR family transcriptional regulator [Treponema sp.]|jgi:AcrR family transcriptional regulator|nr:TetR/AcrR family transcriptional regulator [Treponema sp.]
METLSTKEKILDAAIKLFSSKGYEIVSMRDIAQAVGIKAASIYNHFPAKRDILRGMFDFYVCESQKVFPDLNVMLRLVETAPVQEVFSKVEYYYPPELQEKMDCILITASQGINTDPDCDTFLREHFFRPMVELWVLLFNRMIELGKIEPMDVETFVRVITRYAYSEALLNRSSMKVSFEQWIKCFGMVLSLVKIVQ